MQLPPPIAEQAPVQAGLEQQPAIPAVEQMPAPMQAVPAVSNPAPQTVPFPAQPAPASSSSDVPATTLSAVPAIADDGDLIEKEWVDKAKAIVERNRDDPHTQSEELTVVKAEYLQQRYNKTLKMKQ